MIELLLGHNVPIVTTNYLVRSADVWVRRDLLVQPESCAPERGLVDPSGLSGSHRKIVEVVRRGAMQDRG